MSELDAFEADVRKNIKLLSSDDAKIREKAARWLGEAGDPSAITRLRQIYKEDPDRSVRDAAGYSLGMFRALEQALDSAAAEAVLEQLQDIAVNKQFGRRARFRAATLYRLSLGFIVSIVMLLVFNFVLWPRLEPQLGSLGVTASGGGANTAEIATFVSALKADTLTLQQQYQSVLGGGTVNCDVTFVNPSPLTVEGGLAERANAVLTSFTSAKEAFVQACPPNSTPLGAANIGAPLGQLLPLVQTEIPALEAALGGNQPAAGVTPTVEQTTAEPTAVLPTATPAYDVTPHTSALDAIISRMEGMGGANALLTQYWADASASGSTGGCGQASPTIPEDYVLPEAEVAEAPEQLKLAISLVNTGLALVRRGWDQLTQACSANTLAASVEVGTSTTAAATSAFSNARTILETFGSAG